MAREAQAGSLLRLNGDSDSPVEFVAVGHVTLDQTQSGWRAGGSALYAAATARSLGLSAAIVTSASTDFDQACLDGLAGNMRLSKQTTRFVNEYIATRREQRILATAETIDATQLEAFRSQCPLTRDAITLYCPVANELELPLVPLADDGLCGVTPQGFMRGWTRDGAVSARPWAIADFELERVDVVALSEEDLIGGESVVRELPVRTIAITRGEDGVDLQHERRSVHVRAMPVNESEPTGAGDVFMAALLIALRRGQPPVRSARYASCAASLAVEGPFLGRMLSTDALERRYARYRVEILGERESAHGGDDAQRRDFEAYCDAIESMFFRQKGQDGRLSPSDFSRVRRWYEQAWDLHTVERGIDDAFREQTAGRGRADGQVNTLAYCESFVRQLVEAQRP